MTRQWLSAEPTRGKDIDRYQKDVSVPQCGWGQRRRMTGGHVGLLSTRRKNLRPVCRSVQCHNSRKHVSEIPSSDCQVQGAKHQKHPGQDCSATCWTSQQMKGEPSTAAPNIEQEIPTQLQRRRLPASLSVERTTTPDEGSSMPACAGHSATDARWVLKPPLRLH